MIKDLGEREKALCAHVFNQFVKTENPYVPGCDFLFPVFVPWIRSLKDIGPRQDIPLVYIWFSEERNGFVVSVNGNWILDILDELMDEDEPPKTALMIEIRDFILQVSGEIVSKTVEKGIPLEIGFEATNPPATWECG